MDNCWFGNDEDNKNNLMVSMKKAFILEFDACQYNAGLVKASGNN